MRNDTRSVKGEGSKPVASLCNARIILDTLTQFSSRISSRTSEMVKGAIFASRTSGRISNQSEILLSHINVIELSHINATDSMFGNKLHIAERGVGR